MLHLIFGCNIWQWKPYTDAMAKLKQGITIRQVNIMLTLLFHHIFELLPYNLVCCIRMDN